ncbi:hypothetical protein [Pyxidicoccus caerfyrddinensis]|uniref:hypothetical protein n=1 Tax=Pyxidicoccus caerfyrddinensis TaxID=2709663 RepID=UPI001F079BA2|nr:hypothetical protein [Pyxidicoccus caerfyrddinensis]
MSEARPPAAASARERSTAVREPEGLPRRLEHLEQLMEAELGALRAGTEPLVDTLRQGARALEPGPGGTRPAPKEREAWRARLLQSLDVLEDVLEGLQLASRADAGGRRD